MTDSADDVAAGCAAWERIKDNARTSWSDWVLIGKALIAGRTEAMREAGINRPFGATYVRIFGAWLREHGLDGIDTQQRYRCIVCIENLEAIEEWRAALDEKQRDAWNHPGAVWAHWKRHTPNAETSARSQHFVKSRMPSHKDGRPIYWPQSFLRRGAEAYRECRSNDLFVIVRHILERTVRSENDLIELLDAARQPRQSKPSAVAPAHAEA
jgi:hypothetical protein